jgi:SlyX protein
LDQHDFTKRFETIETKLAFLEDFLNRLQDEVVVRNSALDRVIAENKAIKEKLAFLAQNQEEIPSQKPPHY